MRTSRQNRRDLSRRGLLQYAVGGVGTALPGLAGCITPAASRAPEALDRASYRSWLYAPRTVGETAHNACYFLGLAAIRARQTVLARPTYEKYRNYATFVQTDEMDIEPERIEALLLVYPLSGGSLQGAVLAGAARPDRVRARLRRAAAERASHRGVDLYASIDRTDTAVGIHRRHVLIGHATGTHRARDVVRAMIDAAAGATDRYHRANADFGALTDVLGTGADVSGFTHERRQETAVERGSFAGAVAKGHRYRFDDDGARSRYAFVFEADVDLAAVEGWIDAHDRLFGGYATTTVARQGRVAIVDGRLSMENL